MADDSEGTYCLGIVPNYCLNKGTRNWLQGKQFLQFVNQHLSVFEQNHRVDLDYIEQWKLDV